MREDARVPLRGFLCAEGYLDILIHQITGNAETTAKENELRDHRRGVVLPRSEQVTRVEDAASCLWPSFPVPDKAVLQMLVAEAAGLHVDEAIDCVRRALPHLSAEAIAPKGG